MSTNKSGNFLNTTNMEETQQLTQRQKHKKFIDTMQIHQTNMINNKLKKKMNKEHWGPLKTQQLIEPEDFWCIFDELCDSKSEFLYNRNYILNAFKNGQMYGLRVEETDAMFKNKTALDPIFCSEDCYYLLPCFIIVTGNTANIIWTHPRARRRGFASKLVKQLHIKYAQNPQPKSLAFWKSQPQIKFIS